MILEVHHRTIYSYSLPVSISHHVLHLTPRSLPRQRLERSAIALTPAPAVLSERIDYFGNATTYVTVQQQHTELVIDTQSRVALETAALPEANRSMPWEMLAQVVAQDRSPAGLERAQYLYESPHTAARADLDAYARVSFLPGRPVLEAACDLTRRIHADFRYQGGATDVSTPIDRVFAERAGVCQDFAHLEIACLHALGLPARYVSGYLLTRPPPGTERLVGADASHAWLSLWIGDDWIDLDPTNDLIPNGEHVTLGWGRDYGDVSPVRGAMFGGGAHQVSVAVDVVPVEEAA